VRRSNLSVVPKARLLRYARNDGGYFFCRLLLAIAATSLLGLGPGTARSDSLPTIGPAPEFTLTTQDGKRLSIEELRGKVVVVTFIFASCADTCPLLTHKMAMLQPRLGSDFGPQAYFVSVTVDPERDTVEVLKRYAQAHGAKLSGWAFLTGSQAEIKKVAKAYGVVYKKTARGDVDHTFLTSVVDRNGLLRVQYLGTRFNPDELLKDIRSLLEEKR
jgi:protein SCO1